MGDMEDADEVVDMDNMDMDAIVDMDRERSESVPSTPARATAPSCLLYDQSHQPKTLSPRAALAVFFLSDTDCPSSSSPRDHIHLRFRFPLSPLYST